MTEPQRDDPVQPLAGALDLQQPLEHAKELAKVSKLSEKEYSVPLRPLVPARGAAVVVERNSWGPDDLVIEDDDLTDDDAPGPDEVDDVDLTDEEAASMAELLDEDTERADLNPTGDDDVFKRYWIYGKGRPRWNTWRELVAHLVKHVPLGKAKRIAAEWFHERYGFWPGDDRNRVRQGKPPRGKRIGPG